MKVRIYKPAKSTMQSGRANSRQWVLEYETETPRRPEDLMGWTSAGDTLGQVRLRFKSKAAAIAFAEEKGWEYMLQEPKKRIIQPRSYMDNFKYRPPQEEKTG
ncbi:MAG: oxidoreductase [Micavibrio sp.]|nr:MAG: oxidoreductase [Micavibrio sp.]